MLPTFPVFAGNVQIWFHQMELYFSAHSVEPEMRLGILFCGLPAQLARSASDLISGPYKRYEEVKAEILRRNTPSAQQKFRSLMEDDQIGDRTPTEYLARLRELSGGASRNEELLKRLFLSRLPSTVTAVLAPSADQKDLDELAAMADKICEFSACGGTASQSPADRLIASTSGGRGNATIDSLTKQMELMSIKLDKLCSERVRTQSQSSRGRRNSNNFTSRTRESSVPGLCWYHARFGTRANRCIAPCTFSSEKEN